MVLAVEKFRCIHDLELDLAGLTVLVGPSGSGKSTVVDAIRAVTGGAWPPDRRASVEVQGVTGAVRLHPGRWPLTRAIATLRQGEARAWVERWATHGLGVETFTRAIASGCEEISAGERAYLQLVVSCSNGAALVVVDDLELHLGGGLLAAAAALLEDTAQRCVVLCTTHSESVLSAFRSALVYRCTRDSSGVQLIPQGQWESRLQADAPLVLELC